MMRPCKGRIHGITVGTALLCSFALLAIALSPAMSNAQDAAVAGAIYGTYYLALDAAPFGLPPGTNLPGLAVLHSDRTFAIVDGGDFGGVLGARDTAQLGTWMRGRGGKIHAVSLFLRADDATGTVLSWQKVEFTLMPEGRDKLVGVVNVAELLCDAGSPFPVFACPDPVAGADAFLPLPPFDIPIEFARLSVR